MKDFDVFYLLKSHEDILMIPYDGLCFNFMDFFYRILIILDKIIKQLICLYENFWPQNSSTSLVIVFFNCSSF